MPAGNGLGFEYGPTTDVQLQWGTYRDAADQAGLSRIWGGIHPPADDLPGRVVGAQCGQGAWALARRYFDGTVDGQPFALITPQLGNDGQTARPGPLRGFQLKMQPMTGLGQPSTNEPSLLIQALDPSLTSTNASDGPGKFYQLVRTLTP